MAYDNNKDKLIKNFDLETSSDSKISFSVYSYNGGNPKLQINRTKDEKFLKVGRMSLEEVEFLKEVIDEIVEEMKANQKG